MSERTKEDASILCYSEFRAYALVRQKVLCNRVTENSLLPNQRLQRRKWSKRSNWVYAYCIKAEVITIYGKSFSYYKRNRNRTSNLR